MVFPIISMRTVGQRYKWHFSTFSVVSFFFFVFFFFVTIKSGLKIREWQTVRRKEKSDTKQFLHVPKFMVCILYLKWLNDA